MGDEKRKKGTFSDLRLPVLRGYVFPVSRKTMMIAGGIGALAVLCFFLFNSFFQKSGFISSGPLASPHATFEENCEKCHKSFRSVTDAKCSICHEKSGDRLGVYTFAAHYVYRSREESRVKPAMAKHQREMRPCASCHPEHEGRQAQITNVPDSKCTQCHKFGSFNRQHPEFEFARKSVPDDSALIFTHIRHTKFVLAKLQQQSGSNYIERTCLYCHNPQSDGKNFMPLDYDRHCGDCHLNAAVETPKLAVKDPANPNVPGVETLEMIKARRGPGTLWAFYANPYDFNPVDPRPGARVSKTPIYHEDPWILENLKLIRQRIYPDSGLTELLKTSGNTSRQDPLPLYNEAIQTLQDYVTGLRDRPQQNVRSDLVRIDSLLRVARRRLSAAPSALSESLFTFRSQNLNLDPDQRKAFEDLASKLTRPKESSCQECHMVESAGIARVQSDQRTLLLAEFDHRAHILERRCLDCHVEIPVPARVENIDSLVTAADKSKDRAAVQNIPKIANCRDCHSEEEASNRCVTCHYFHPNKTNRASLELFVEKP